MNKIHIRRHKNNPTDFIVEVELNDKTVMPEIIWRGIVKKVEFAFYYLRERPKIPSYTIDLKDEFNVGG